MKKTLFAFIEPKNEIIPSSEMKCPKSKFFLPHDALVHSAVLRLHVLRLSLRRSVTLVDQDHVGWKPWKLIARSIGPTPSLFVAQRPST